MTERTGGSKTILNGKVVDVVNPPTTHPDGNRSRDAQGRPRNFAAPSANPAPAGDTVADADRDAE